ncbi:MAG: alkaline phosphatase family protein [Chloroflexota bacterium]
MKWFLILAACLAITAAGNVSFAQTPETTETPAPPERTVFVILMENHNWDHIKGNSHAPYINSLLLEGAHAEQYYNPHGLHPSEPNYIWLEAGRNFGVTDDLDPVSNHIASTDHLTALLDAAGISWKTYQEGTFGDVCPLTSHDHYAAKHNPMIFFDDVTDSNDPHSANCLAHMRPYEELSADLANDTLARYIFITPDTCNDMHDASGCVNRNSVQNGDEWLSSALPPILASDAYQNGGIVFITWDEGSGDVPIGLIALSKNAKVGYSNEIPYTHSSLLRTLEEIFGVTPLLGDAANATDLSDLFTTFP